MGIAADLHGRAFGQAGVSLTQLEAVPLGLPYQSLQRLEIELRVGRMSDGLGLHGGVDADPLQTGGPHRAALQPGLDRLSQQLLQSFWSEPLAPARQRAGITRQLMLEVRAATEPLVIRILDPALHHRLIGQVEGMLEIGQAHHQARRLRGSSERTIEAAELLIEAIPVDQNSQAEQRVAGIEDLVEAAAVEIAGTRQRRLGSHGKTPGLSGSSPDAGILQCFVTTKNPSVPTSCGLFRAD